MAAAVGQIEAVTRQNRHYRHVIFTSRYSQLAVMCLQPGERLGCIPHTGAFQYFRVESGEGRFVFEDTQEERLVSGGERVLMPRGVGHHVHNASETAPLKFYSISSPPTHADSTLHRTQAEADAAARAGVGLGARFTPVE